MKLLIIIDQEGCSNVTIKQPSHVRNQHMINELEKFINTIPNDINITVLDCHNNGLNVISLKEKFPNISFVPQIWNFNIKEHYDMAILIGFHAAQGVDSPFSHTFRMEIVETLLNDNIVGEVTLIVRWLQSYNIPVLFVHGEKELKNEVEELRLPFISNSSSLSFISNCKPQPIYKDNKKIKIRLIRNKMLDAFPVQIFKIENDYLVFNNIEHYLLNLSNVSIFLNAAQNYYLMYIKRLLNSIKWNYTKKEIEELNDTKLNDILNNSNILTISAEDIDYIQERLKIK